MTDAHKRFLRMHLSWVIVPLLLFGFTVLSVPALFTRDPKSDLVKLKGHINGLKIHDGAIQTETTFDFTVKEFPKSAFRATNLFLGDQHLLARIEPGTELNFTVEREKLDRDDGSRLLVSELSSATNVYLHANDLSSMIQKGKMFAAFMGITTFCGGCWFLARVRRKWLAEINRKKDDEKAGPENCDPLVIAMAHHPQRAAGAAFGLLWIVLLVLLPDGTALLSTGVSLLGFGGFYLWFRFYGEDVEWINLVLAAEKQKKDLAIANRTVTNAPKYQQALELIIKAGRDINIRDKDGRTPLQIAASFGHVEAVDLLLRNGAGIDLADDTGETALMSAIKAGSMGTVMKLLGKGADPLLKTRAGDTALTFAAANKKSKAMNDVINRATVKAELAAKAKAAAEAAEAAKSKDDDARARAEAEVEALVLKAEAEALADDSLGREDEEVELQPKKASARKP